MFDLDGVRSIRLMPRTVLSYCRLCESKTIEKIQENA